MLLRVSILLPVYLACTTVSAYAYLDPGTGSIILQGAIAAVATGLFMMKSYLHRLKRFFGLGRTDGDDVK